MKQQEISDKTYKELMRLSEIHQNDYDAEVTRRNKHASDQQLAKYTTLIEEYYIFAKNYEDIIPYMYLDSSYYFTVGCGHFLGFDKFDFWTSKEAKDVLENLIKQIESEKLEMNSSFKDLPLPVDVDAFLNVSEEDLLKLFKTKYVSLGFLDTKSLKYKTSEGKRDIGQNFFFLNENEINNPQLFLTTVLTTYVKLLGLAVKLKARQQKLNRDIKNPFKGLSFYTTGENSLVLNDEQIKKLAFRDILVKLGETKSRLNKFDDFPLTAQKALLDLAYNRGSLPPQVIALALEENWGKLTNTKLYERSGSEFTDRNAKIELWFKEAETAKALKEAETAKALKEAETAKALKEAEIAKPQTVKR
jgi:hypothetical protein